MKKLLLLITTCFVATSANSQSITRLLSAEAFTDQIHILDTSTYAVVGVKTTTFSVGSISGFNGMAKNNATGVVYVLVRSTGGRYLASYNPTTGALTNIGLAGSSFAGITFNGNNTLLGITGDDGSPTGRSVFRINTTNANKTLLSGPLPNGCSQAICYNPLDNKVYRWSGCSPYICQSYDTSFVSATAVSSGASPVQLFGAVYNTANTFLLSDSNDDVIRENAIGTAATNVGTLPGLSRSISYITCSRSITATPATTVICGSNTSTLSMSGTAGATYQWFKNNVAVPSATLSTLPTLLAGYYKCQITDGCGMDSLAAGITLTVAPLPIVAVSGSTLLCPPSTITLTASFGGTSQWYKNGVLIPGAITNSLTVSSIGLYNMIKTNTNGCKDSAAIGKTVILDIVPTISASSSNSVICIGETAILNLTTSATSYTWNTGATTLSISVSPTVTTNYIINGTGSNGCTNSANVNVTVNACTGLNEITSSLVSVYPNPNNGILNISLTSELSHNSTLEVYDALGKLVVKQALTKELNSVNISNLDNGIYVFKVLNNSNNTVKIGKLIKQ